MLIMEDKKIAVIGVDHGYGNIKTANTVMPTGITMYDSEPVFSGNILEYDGKYYRIGEGHKDFIPDKSMDADFYLLTLMAVARELNIRRITQADVHLAVGLPLTWVRAQRDTFRAYLMQNERVCFQYNKKKYDVRFVGCSVYPQGYPAILNHAESMKNVSMLADIGNGTMNILYIIGKKPVESKCWTEKFGVNQCVIAARNAVMDSYGVKIDESLIEQVLRKGTADIAGRYLDCITDAARKYTDGIFAVLRKYEYDPDLMRLIIAGGGGCLVRNFGQYDESRVTILDDICAAAKGYEFLAYSSLRRKERV